MRKNLKSRAAACLLTAAMALSACGAASQNATAPAKTAAAGAETGVSGSVSDAAGSEEGSPSAGTAGSDAVDGDGSLSSGSGAAPAVYEYEQPLQIIDDNYRNYYEIFVYSFCDSDGDGIGDLNGVAQKLDYISDMGFNAIWFMPLMQSTTYHKYDVVDYRSIDREYGTIDDFRSLVEQCHDRGIRVIIDFVINHSSSQNQWFLDACDYLRSLPDGAEPDPAACPSVDYYHFSREKVNGTYYPVRGSGWYYEGSFWSEMPDLNLASEALRAELEDIAAYWIEMGVDGFRMDAALHFEESADDFNIEVLNWLYNYCRGLDDDFYMVSEVWAGRATIASYYKSGTPSMFNFDVADAEGKLIKAARGNYYAASLVQAMAGYQTDFRAANPDFIDAPFITNHDMGRAANALRQDEHDLKMACGLLMMMNGSPYVYYGEEIGMSSSGTKDENKRLPMLWSDTDPTGMTDGPADADAGITSSFAGVEEQLKDPSSILNYYRRALRIRNENPAIARGDIAVVESLTDGHQAAVTKTWEGATIGIVFNTSDESMDIDLAGTGLADMTIRGYLTVDGSAVTLNNSVLTLPGQGICILQ